MINLFIQFLVLFVLLFIFFLFSSSDKKISLLKASMLAITISVLSLLPNYLGITGWFIAFVITLMLISKIVTNSFVGSLLFLIILGLAQNIILLAISKFI